MKNRIASLVDRLRSMPHDSRTHARVLEYSAAAIATSFAAQGLDHPLPVLASALIGPAALKTAEVGKFLAEELPTPTDKAIAGTLILGTSAALAARLMHIDDGLANTASYEFAREVVQHAPVHLGIAAAGAFGAYAVDRLVAKTQEAYSRLTRSVRAGISSAAALSALTVSLLGAPHAPTAQSDTDGWNIAYTQKLDAGVRPADRMQIARVLGSAVAARTQEANTDSGVALVYNRVQDADSAQAASLAATHQAKLAENGYFIHARAIHGSETETRYKLSFGKGRNEDVLKARRAIIQKRLGDDVQLDLERADDGELMLVSRSSTDKQQALYLAARAERALWGDEQGKSSLEVTITQDRNRMHEVERARNSSDFRWVNRGLVEDNIQSQVNQLVSNLRQQGTLPAANEAQLGIAVYSHTRNGWVALYDPDTPRLLGSMAKAPVAFAYEQGIASGYLPKPMAPALWWQRLAHEKKMLWLSSNVESNYFLDNFGGPTQTANLLRQWYPEVFSGLRLRERIPDEGEAAGRTYKNTITPRSNTAMHATIYKGLVANDGMRETLLDGLGVNGPLARISTMLGGGGTKLLTDDFPDDTHIDNKTGTTGMNSADGGTITTPDHVYSITIQLDRATPATDYAAWRKQSKLAIRALSAGIYKALTKNSD